jgi:hypothetical protein
VLFASDVAVWNIAIQNQVLLKLPCLSSSALGGYYLVFLNTKPATFLIGTTVALFGMAGRF